LSRWLVTGAGGQVGRACLALAQAHGIEAVGLDHRLLDVRDDLKRLLDQHQPDVVLNAAAITAVDRCEKEQLPEAEAVNAVAPGLLARACQGGPLLVHLSTDFVFDGRATQPIPENASTGPLNAYGRTKLAGEKAVRDVGGEHLIVRTQWVFGEGVNFVRTIRNAAKQGNPLRVVNDQFGRPTWSESLASGIFAAVAAGARETLHLANEGSATWFDLACAVVAHPACAKVEVIPIPTAEMPRPAKRPAYGVLGLDRAHSLGIELPHWRQALAEYLTAEQEHRDA
jgi:dTDP-4-dehydrorhamnose reductase